MEDITTLRRQIDEIDRKIAELLELRMEASRKVGAYKAENRLPILDPERERQLLDDRAALLPDKRLADGVRAVFETILAQSRALQSADVDASDPQKRAALAQYRAMLLAGGEHRAQRVLYQGQPGAYGEEAAMGYFGADCDRMNLKTWDGVFRGIRDGFGDFGVVPIENSSTGSIQDVYDLLGRFGCCIVGEYVVRVEHCLMACADANLHTITDVYSHEQGLLQCRAFLEDYPGWGQHVMANTALSAKFVAESSSPAFAAIASRRAAELYGLQILQTRINDNPHNYTRFLIVAAQPEIAPEANKVSVSFTVAHTQGSLCRVLQVFARARLNLLKLESRPIPEKSWEYRFFADFSGNLRAPGMEELIRSLLEETVSLRILGNYRAAER